MAHTMQKQDERDNTKELSVAVKILGQAKEDLLEAENAKAQLSLPVENLLATIGGQVERNFLLNFKLRNRPTRTASRPRD